MSSLVPQYMLHGAGAVKDEAFKELEPRGLRVLAPLTEVSAHVFVTRSDMPPAMVAKLRQGLPDIKFALEGKHIMQSIHKDMTNLVPAEDSDYHSPRMIMRAIGVMH